MNIITVANGQFRDGSKRFRFIGGNNYGLLYTTNPAAYDDTYMQNFFAGCARDGIRVVRTWLYNEPNQDPTQNVNGNFWYWNGSSVQYRDAQFQVMDRALYWAVQYGIRLLPSFGDWATGNMIGRYLQLNDLEFGTHYQSGQIINITSLSWNAGTGLATAVTASPHELYAQTPANTYCLVQVQNASISGYNVLGSPVTAVINPTTFTYGINNPGGGTPTGAQMKRGDGFWSPTTQAYFHVSTIKQNLKNFISQTLNRISTRDGITYKNHPGIFAWELMNEARYGQTNETNTNSSSSNNVIALTAWASEISAYIKSIDSNHLVGFGDMSHRYGYVQDGSNPDQVYNGSYYGGDPTVLGALSTIDYIDMHVYPYQWDNTQLRSNPGWYGLQEGYGYTALGVKMAMSHFIQDAKALGKPCIIGEWGVIKATTSNDRYVNYPRYWHFKKAIDDFFADNGDGFIMWHYYPTDGEFDENYGISGVGWYTHDGDPDFANGTILPGRNDNDTILLNYCKMKNNLFAGNNTIGILSQIADGTPLAGGV